MDENLSGADLEEAHYYHVIKEFYDIVERHGWEAVELTLNEIHSQSSKLP